MSPLADTPLATLLVAHPCIGEFLASLGSGRARRQPDAGAVAGAVAR